MKLDEVQKHFTPTYTHRAAHPAMLLIERLLERLFPVKVMMLVCLRDGTIKVEWSSGGKMADQGRSFVPPAGPEQT